MWIIAFMYLKKDNVQEKLQLFSNFLSSILIFDKFPLGYHVHSKWEFEKIFSLLC